MNFLRWCVSAGRLPTRDLDLFQAAIFKVCWVKYASSGVQSPSAVCGHWFTNLADARALIEAWRRDYNEHRPKNGIPPAVYAARLDTITTSTIAQR